MKETEQLSLLLRDIYDAALSPSRWAQVVQASADYIGAFAGSIVVSDKARFHFSRGQGYGALEEESRKYPVIRGSNRILREKDAISVAAALPMAELAENPFYNHWCQPQGVRDVLTYGFTKAPESGSVFRRIGGGAGFALHQDATVSSEEAIRRMRLIAPHMRRAVLIANAIHLGDAETASFINLLDGLRAGVFLIDARQRLVHANASGRELLAEGEILHITEGRLVPNEAAGAELLETAVARTAKAGGAPPAGALAMPLKTATHQCYVAHLLPLDARRRGGSGQLHDAVAALIVHRAEIEMSPSYQSFVQRYKLTPAEARVSLAIVEIGGIPEAASALGLGSNTVRTHLQRVFSKTGIRRQAELVKLFASPLLR